MLPADMQHVRKQAGGGVGKIGSSLLKTACLWEALQAEA